MQYTRKPVKFPHLTRIPLRSSVFGSSAPRPQGGGAPAGRVAGNAYEMWLGGGGYCYLGAEGMGNLIKLKDCRVFEPCVM